MAPVTAATRLFRPTYQLVLGIVCLVCSARGAVFHGSTPSSYTGSAVALSPSGTILAMGAPNHDPSGRVQVFVRTDQAAEWVQRGEDLIPEGGIRSGSAVTVSETSIVAIGSPYADEQRGHVDVYEWSGSSWKTVGQTLTGAAPQDLFGCSVSISEDGTVLAIAARLNDDNGDNSGHVQVFVRSDNEDGERKWIPRGHVIQGETEFDGSGFAISLSSNGEALAIGAPANRNYRGCVRAFEWNADMQNWVERGDGIIGDTEFDFLGWSVDMSADGSRLAVGAPYHNAANSHKNAGQVKVYEWNDETWQRIGEAMNGEEEKEAMGNSVALSPDGAQLAIGSSQGKTTHGAHAGHVRVFLLVGGSWVRRDIRLEGELQGDRFGHSLALASDGALAVGVRQSNANAGHVETFDLHGTTE